MRWEWVLEFESRATHWWSPWQHYPNLDSAFQNLRPNLTRLKNEPWKYRLRSRDGDIIPLDIL